MHVILPNNTVKISGHSIPFDLFAEACVLLVSRSNVGCGVEETPSFVIFHGIGVIRKEQVRKASRSISFKYLRNGG